MPCRILLSFIHQWFLVIYCYSKFPSPSSIHCSNHIGINTKPGVAENLDPHAPNPFLLFILPLPPSCPQLLLHQVLTRDQERVFHYNQHAVFLAVSLKEIQTINSSSFSPIHLILTNKQNLAFSTVFKTSLQGLWVKT